MKNLLNILLMFCIATTFAQAQNKTDSVFLNFNDAK
jgi:hypothetical protein